MGRDISEVSLVTGHGRRERTGALQGVLEEDVPLLVWLRQRQIQHLDEDGDRSRRLVLRGYREGALIEPLLGADRHCHIDPELPRLPGAHIEGSLPI